MAGTFEIIFSGLCLFLFDGNPPHSVEVNLVRTRADAETYCAEAGNNIHLPAHQPRLVVPEQWVEDCSSKDENGVCSPGDMPFCSAGRDSAWICDIADYELCVDVKPHGPPFSVASIPSTVGVPNNPDSARAFGWIAELGGIGGSQIQGLDSRVQRETSVVGNPLVASRIHSTHGQLTSMALGQWNSRYVLWKVLPSSVYPRKALTEHVSLKIDHATGRTIRLESCESSGSYWWEFKPQNDQDIVIGVQNLAIDECDYEQSTSSAEDDCTTSTPQYPHRLRHYLWYYELIEWSDGCPDYLPAPACPEGNCQKDRLEELRPIRADTNVLCPPTTYP